MIKSGLQIALLGALCFGSCGDPPPAKQAVDENKLKQQFMEANKQLAQKENDDMDSYQRNHKLPLVSTPLGIRYYVYTPSEKGDSIRSGDIVLMSYTISLLDGTECYSSTLTGPKEFVVGQDQIESGIHRGVQFLKNGDKALLMIPSHLAHGLLGDSKKIPPQSPIIYDVQILAVRKAPEN